MKEHTLTLESCVKRIFSKRTLKVKVPHPYRVLGREVLGEVIGKVFSSLLTVEAELILLDAAAHPVETHVKRFGALPAHVSGEDAVGGCAVGLIITLVRSEE